MNKIQAKKIESLTEQLNVALAIEAMFMTEWNRMGQPQLAEGYGMGWNAAHGMVMLIQTEIHQAGLPEIPASELGTYELVLQNID